MIPSPRTTKGGAGSRLLLTITAAASLGLTPVAQAHHKPNSYCSPSGDICQSTRKDDGKRVLTITLAANYFDRYRLCVQAPDDTRSCKRFKINDHDDLLGDRVRWKRHFPDAAGSYAAQEARPGPPGPPLHERAPIPQIAPDTPSPIEHPE